MFTTARTFFTSKTTITSLVAIVGALAAAYQHQITWPEAVAAIWAALQAMWLRDAVAKHGETVAGAVREVHGEPRVEASDV